MSFREPRILGRTGIATGRLGISSSYRAPCEAFEEAFAQGCNYFTWGTFIRGRSGEMAKAVRRITAQGERDKLILGLLSYAHHPWLGERFFLKGLRELATDHADVLLLGYYNTRPAQAVIDGAMKLKERGLVRHIGLTSHSRTLIAKLLGEEWLDVVHVRYNAAHRGAEEKVFPFVRGDDRPGIVSFTATRWRRLLDPKRMPLGEPPPSAADCYRFALANPAVDLCMMGAASLEQMRENLGVLDMEPLDSEELIRLQRIGDHLNRRRKTVFFL